MIALLLGLAVAIGAPVDVERGRTALELERPADALEHARVAMAADPGDWQAARLYAQALAATGQEALVGIELSGLAGADPRAGVVRDWYRVEAGEAEPDTLASWAEGEASELATFALAWLAWERGAPEVALGTLGQADDPWELAVRLAALRATGDDRAAVAIADRLRSEHPEQPDALVPLFEGEAESGRVRRARRRALRSVTALVEDSTDPAVLYRARRLLARAAADEGAERAVERLQQVGEPAVLPRTRYNSAMRRSMARALAMTASPELPEGTPSEVVEIALQVARALRDMGRVDQALAVFEQARERVDDPALALAHGEQLLRMGKAGRALEVAGQARRLASDPAPQDIARLDGRAWRSELGAAWALTAAARLATDRPQQALEAAAVAAHLDATADSYEILGRAHAALGHQEAAFSALAVAQALGAPVVGELGAAWYGVGAWEQAAVAAVEAWRAGAGPAAPDTAEAPQSGRPQVGQPLGDWQVDTEAGPLSSSDLEGQVVVLAFWASWCAPCKVELPELSRLALGWAAEGRPVTVVAVSIDDRERDYARFLERHEVEGLRVAWAPALGRELRVSALPSTWIIDGEGVVRHYHQGFAPGTEQVLEHEVEELAR